MARIGYRMSAHELPAVTECKETTSEDAFDGLPDNVVKRLLNIQFSKKASHLACEYLHYNNAYGEAQLQKLVELKRAYMAMI